MEHINRTTTYANVLDRNRLRKLEEQMRKMKKRLKMQGFIIFALLGGLIYMLVLNLPRL